MASGRCRRHRAAYERWQHRTVPTKRSRTTEERKRRGAVVRAWVSMHGWRCPGYGRPPHDVAEGDLTAEHIVAVADAGEGAGPLTALCRSCNSRHGAETGRRYRL